ncbi:MAG: hypothetical protein NVS3B10_15540 [Polyangiales bacterium]
MFDPTTLTFGARLSQLAESTLAQVAQGAGQAAPAAPAGSSPAAPAASSSGSMMQLAFPILIFVAFYFFLIRPQQRKAKDLDSKLKKGDRVFTNSGLIGKVITLGDKRATLEIAPNVRVEVLRSAIGGLDEGDDAKSKDEKIEKVAEAKK